MAAKGQIILRIDLDDSLTFGATENVDKLSSKVKPPAVHIGHEYIFIYL